MNIRKLGLKVVDELRGSILKKNLEDIDFFYSKQNDNTSRLKECLEKASSEVGFYQKYKNLSLESWPVLEKKMIQKDPLSFMNPQFNKKDLIEMRTSGSTGMPLSVYQNYEKKKRVHAEIIYFNQKFGHDLGNAYIFAKSFDTLSPMSAYLKNEQQVDITNMSEETFTEVLKLIEKGKMSAVLAYASFYRELLTYMTTTTKKFNVKKKLNTIISTASYLDLSTKEKLTNVFEASIIDRYSNQENGLIAHAVGISDVYKVNTASYYVEILDAHTYQPVQIGERGIIVITDLYNESMPLIRYNSGDLATLRKYDPKQGVLEFEQLAGRVVNTIDLDNGDVITTHSISVFFRKYPFVTDFKVQAYTKSKKVYVKLLTDQKEIDEKDLQRGVDQLFNHEYNVKIELHEKIEYRNMNKKEVLEIIHK